MTQTIRKQQLYHHRVQAHDCTWHYTLSNQLERPARAKTTLVRVTGQRKDDFSLAAQQCCSLPDEGRGVIGGHFRQNGLAIFCSIQSACA